MSLVRPSCSAICQNAKYASVSSSRFSFSLWRNNNTTHTSRRSAGHRWAAHVAVPALAGRVHEPRSSAGFVRCELAYVFLFASSGTLMRFHSFVSYRFVCYVDRTRSMSKSIRSWSSARDRRRRRRQRNRHRRRHRRSSTRRRRRQSPRRRHQQRAPRSPRREVLRHRRRRRQR